MEHVVQALEAMNSPDNDSRQAAESWLTDIKQESLGDLMGAFSTILCSTEYEPMVRSQAGLQLKNCISGQHGAIRDIDRQNWSEVPEETRTQIKQSVLAALGTEPTSPSTAAQVYATIATIELEHWESAMPDLLARIGAADSEDLVVAVLDAVGYMTLDISKIDPDLLQPHSSDILSAVVGSMNAEGASSRVLSTSLKALSNSLDFCEGNFQQDGEREFIIQSVGALSTSADEKVATEALLALGEIINIYYTLVGDFMDPMSTVVNSQMTNESDDIAIAAMEFWSTVADRELDFEENEEDHANYCLQYLEAVLPSTLHLLSRQDEDDDQDEFTVSKCASVALGFLAEVVRDPIVDPTIEFVRENMGNEAWNFRDAAVMAFGAVLSGPTPEKLTPILQEAALPIMNLIHDPSVIVQDTVAWAVGRMTEMYPEVMLQEEVRIPMLGCLADALTLEPRVASNACWAFTNVIEESNRVALETLDAEAGVGNPPTSILSGDFETILNLLNTCSQREDVDEGHLFEAVFEGLAALVQSAPDDCLEYVHAFASSTVDRLREVAASEPASQSQLKTMISLQGRLCSVIQASMTVLHPESLQEFADSLAEVLNHILTQTSSAYQEIAEDALIAVDELIRRFGQDALPYVEGFKDIVTSNIRNTNHGKTCAVAVGVLSDMFECLGEHLLPSLQELLALLMEVLAVPDLDRDVKPQILVTIGDMATAVSVGIVPFLPMVLQVLESVLHTAASPIPEHANDDDADFQHQLRENLIEAYTAVFQCLTTEDAQATDALMSISSNIATFLEALNAIAQDPQLSPSCARLIAGFIGDALRAFQASIKPSIPEALIAVLLDHAKENQDDEGLVTTVQWMQGHYNMF